MGSVKRCLIINRRAPHGTIHAWEGLELAFTLAAFEHEVTLLFLDDGVFQLRRAQGTEAIGTKNFAPAFACADDYGIANVFAETSSLVARGLSPRDLLLPVKAVDADGIRHLIESNDIVIPV